MFCHPEASRPLSIGEYKRIPGFPDDWKIEGNISKKYRLIGNAVPAHLSYAIAKKVSGLLGIPAKRARLTVSFSEWIYLIVLYHKGIS
jgi:site-specific DNA-cytosine methylase